MVIRVELLPQWVWKLQLSFDPEEIKDRTRWIWRKVLDLLKLLKILNHVLQCAFCLSTFFCIICPLPQSVCNK